MDHAKTSVGEIGRLILTITLLLTAGVGVRAQSTTSQPAPAKNEVKHEEQTSSEPAQQPTAKTSAATGQQKTTDTTPKKPKRGQLIIAPIPITSPAVGSGLVLALGYVFAQLAGAIVGALPLRGWGSMGESVAFGATLPGQGYAIRTVLMGEAITTFALIAGLCLFLGFRTLRPFTPAMFPFLYAFMVYAESPISGTSTSRPRCSSPSM